MKSNPSWLHALEKPVSDPRALWRESSIVGLIGLVLFAFGFDHQPFVNFETRFAVFAEEMWRHGITLFPTAYGEPYPDYPVTSTIFIYAVSLLFGGVTKFTAILPTAIFSAVDLLLLYRLLAPFSRLWGLLSLCFALLTATFLAEARSISLDQMLATATLGAFYVAYRSETDPGAHRWWSLAAFLVIGFCIRGPLGIVIPAGAVGSLYVLSGRWGALLQFAMLSIGLLAACWGGLLGLAYVIHGAPFVADVVRMQVAGRLGESVDASYAYYFTSSFGNYALAYPVAVVVGALAIGSGRTLLRDADARSRLLVYLTGWAAIVLAGLSLAATKKVRYLLPMMPAVAALAAYPLAHATFPRFDRMLRGVRFAVEKLLLVLPLLAVAAALWTQHDASRRALPLQWSPAPIIALLVACQVAVSWIHFARRDAMRTLGVAVGAVSALWILDVCVVEPTLRQLHDTQSFVDQVETARAVRPAALVFFRIGKDAEAIKYLVNLDYDLQPQFASGTRDLDRLAAPVYIVVPDDYRADFLAWPRAAGLEPVVRQRFDNRPYSAYYVPR